MVPCVVEDEPPTGLSEDCTPDVVGKPADETVTPYPVVLGSSVGLPPGDWSVREDSAPVTVVGKPPKNVVGNVVVGDSEKSVCEDCGVVTGNSVD